MASRRRIQLMNVDDFTGGIRVGSNPSLLEKNESPDLLNVDLGPRGGVRLRRGTAPYGATAAADPVRLWGFYDPSGVRQVIAVADGDTYATAGSTWAEVSTSHTPTAGVAFKGKFYGNSTADGGFAWDGSSKADKDDPAPSGWNSNYSSPAGGYLPPSKHMAVYQGHLFVANTLENGTAHRSRVRYSHFNQPEDWADTDFIDIDVGADGDQITALVPTDDRLLVFKEHSVHVVYGDPPDALSTFPLTRAVGAIGPQAVAATDLGVYFVDWPQGVFLAHRDSVEFVGERISEPFRDGTIPFAQVDDISLGWGNRRLWLSVPWEDSTGPARCFVLDPQLSKKGSWTVYDLPVKAFLNFDPPDASQPLYLASIVGKKLLVRLDAATTTDDFGDEDTYKIDSYYMTRWYDAQEPAVRKRWRRPEFVILDAGEAELNVQVFTDWNPSEYRRSFRLRTDANGEFLVWDDGDWDDGVWAPSSDEKNDIERGTSLGSANAVALKISGPLSTNVDWAMHQLVLKYVPRKVRS